MKLKKSTKMITSFAIGLTLFTTTVLAEVSSKSGYEQLKDALKYSSASFENKLSNYTVDYSMSIKDNGKVILSQNSLGKYDTSKHSKESIDTDTKGAKESKSYYYTDKKLRIYKSSSKNIYNVTEFKEPIDGYSFHDPFKESEMADMEKIADAVVGNLKDYVIVNNNKDGSKELSGSIKGTQIPTLINAMSSYMIKHETNSIDNYGDSDSKKIMPSITKDVFVKEATGKMLLDKNGLIKNIFATGTISGKDDAGKEHALTLEVLLKIYNVNSTVVTKPNLSGKKVSKVIEDNSEKSFNPKKYIGKYKNDIIIEDNGKFKKIGERLLTLTSCDNTSISGSYHEEYLKGYENFKEKTNDFKFTAKCSKDDKCNAHFTVKGYESEGSIYLSRNDSEVNFYLPALENNSVKSSNNFYRIFN